MRWTMDVPPCLLQLGRLLRFCPEITLLPGHSLGEPTLYYTDSPQSSSFPNVLHKRGESSRQFRQCIKQHSSDIVGQSAGWAGEIEG